MAGFFIIRGRTGGAAEQEVTPDTASGSGAAYNPTVILFQYSRPASDVTDGNWTNEAENNINLYASIDESVVNDEDYIQSEDNPSSSSCVLGLSSLTDPSSSSYHKARYRYRKTSGEIIQDLIVKLKQGATVIATWTHNDISETWTTSEQTLTTEEADSITDYTALRVEFIADTPA